MVKVTTENYDEVFNNIHEKLKDCVYSASATLVQAIQDALCMALVDVEGFNEASRNEIIEKIRNFNVGADYKSTPESRDFSKVLLIFYVVYASYKGVIKLTSEQKANLGEQYFGCNIIEYIEDYINIENVNNMESSEEEIPVEVNMNTSEDDEFSDETEDFEPEYEDYDDAESEYEDSEEESEEFDDYEAEEYEDTDSDDFE